MPNPEPATFPLDDQDRRITIVTPLCTARQPDREANWNAVYSHLAPIVASSPNLDWIVVEQYSTAATGMEYVHRIEAPPARELNRSQLRNLGWRFSESPMICFLDADFVMPSDSWGCAFEDCWKWGCYSPAEQTSRLDQFQTNQWRERIASDEWDFDIPPRTPKNLCNGICFVYRDVLDRLRGWDERFHGHGHEDEALAYLINQECDCHSGTESCCHLWHPHTGRTSDNKANLKRFSDLYDGRTVEEIIKEREQLGV